MKSIGIISRISILTVCALCILSVASVWAQCTCDPEVDGDAAELCTITGGSWNPDDCTCSGGCNPDLISQCNQQGGNMDFATCTCQPAYNPCSQITELYEVYFYSWCPYSCTGCRVGDICCWADVVYNMYGLGGVYCGQYYVSAYFLGCNYGSYLTECEDWCICGY